MSGDGSTSDGTATRFTEEEMAEHAEHVKEIMRTAQRHFVPKACRCDPPGEIADGRCSKCGQSVEVAT